MNVLKIVNICIRKNKYLKLNYKIIFKYYQTK